MSKPAFPECSWGFAMWLSYSGWGLLILVLLFLIFSEIFPMLLFRTRTQEHVATTKLAAEWSQANLFQL